MLLVIQLGCVDLMGSKKVVHQQALCWEALCSVLHSVGSLFSRLFRRFFSLSVQRLNFNAGISWTLERILPGTAISLYISIFQIPLNKLLCLRTARLRSESTSRDDRDQPVQCLALSVTQTQSIKSRKKHRVGLSRELLEIKFRILN